MPLKINILLNTSKTQQHPFHVLHLSRLPAVMAGGLSGGLAKLLYSFNFLVSTLKKLISTSLVGVHSHHFC